MRRLMMACLILCLVAMPLLCAAMEEDAGASDGLRFKQEYELLNGQSNLDGSNVYQTLNIPEDCGVRYADMESIRSLFDSGTGILFLGFPECPWCRSLVPTLIQAVEDAGFGDTVYYYNALEDRDKKHLDDQGNIVTDEPGTEAYRYLLGELYDHLGAYEGLEDETVKRIYFPTTVFIKDGQVLSVHIDTVDSQTDGYGPLTGEQGAELYELIMAQITALHEDDVGAEAAGDEAPLGAAGNRPTGEMTSGGSESAEPLSGEASDTEGASQSGDVVEIHAFAYDQCGGGGDCDQMMRLRYMLSIPLEAYIKQGNVRIILHNVITDDESDLYERYYVDGGLVDADYREFPTAFMGEAGKDGGALVGAQAIREGAARAVGEALAAKNG